MVSGNILWNPEQPHKKSDCSETALWWVVCSAMPCKSILAEPILWFSHQVSRAAHSYSLSPPHAAQHLCLWLPRGQIIPQQSPA